MHDNSEQDGTSTQAAISKLEEMTAKLRWARGFITGLPHDSALHGAVLDYSVALDVVRMACHDLCRKFYLVENPPQAPTMGTIAGQMRKRGITIDMLRDLIAKQRLAKLGENNNEAS